MIKLFRVSHSFDHVTITGSISATTRRVPQFRYPFSAVRMASTGHTYGEALELLDSLQSNRAVVSTISNASRNMNEDAIPEMIEWTRKAGYEPLDIAKGGLRCIHVAGTKGKGSVSVMVENILLQYRGENQQVLNGERSHIGKVGLYTSPHLITVRERIRIDGSSISETMFAKYFFELWDRFSDADLHSTDTTSTKPGYFRYLTILALHVFIKEGVESAIIECGIGGEYDSTNILPPDAVTVSAITKLGIDHVGMLGDTVGKIAWHKAGIMKEGVPAFTVEQLPEAQAVLDARSHEKAVQLEVVKRNDALDGGNIKLGLEGNFQKDNASLAIVVAAEHLRSLRVSNFVRTQSLDMIPAKLITGLETVQWSGRCQVRDEGKIQWLIDGAHTLDSMHATAEWYIDRYYKAKKSSKPPTANMLIFNQQDRAPEPLIEELIKTIESRETTLFALGLKHFKYAAFCTNTPFKDDAPKDADLSIQDRTASRYQFLDHNEFWVSYSSVEEAVQLARRISDGDDDQLLVLVTGSLHLVGALLQVLDRDQAAAASG